MELSYLFLVLSFHNTVLRFWSFLCLTLKLHLQCSMFSMKNHKVTSKCLMVCWEGNLKINSFLKTFCQPRSSIKVPCLELIFSAGLIFVIIGFSHIAITLEEAYWNTNGITLIVCFSDNKKMFFMYQSTGLQSMIFMHQREMPQIMSL